MRATPRADTASYKYADPKTFVGENAGRWRGVSFASGAATLAAHWYAPAAGAAKVPAVVLIGPETFVKEQAPSGYARRFADRGYASLVFDPTGRGASGGDPRDLESPTRKVADIRAAIDFLETHETVDAERIYAVGICQGSSEMIRAVADDPRVKALATLAGHYRDAQGDAEWLGGPDKLSARLARADAAKKAYDETGVAEIVAAVDKTDPHAGMPGELVWGWYQPWADAGLWPNRFAVMSDAELLRYESMSASARLTVPYLMFHSSQCMLPEAAKRHFERVPGPKRANWWGDLKHFQFYDDPRVIDPAVDEIVAWFGEHGPTTNG